MSGSLRLDGCFLACCAFVLGCVWGWRLTRLWLVVLALCSVACVRTVVLPCGEADRPTREELDEVEGRLAGLEATVGELAIMLEVHTDWTVPPEASEEAEVDPTAQRLEAWTAGGRWR